MAMPANKPQPMVKTIKASSVIFCPLSFIMGSIITETRGSGNQLLTTPVDHYAVALRAMIAAAMALASAPSVTTALDGLRFALAALAPTAPTCLAKSFSNRA